MPETPHSPESDIPVFQKNLFDFREIFDASRHPVERAGHAWIYLGIMGIVAKLSSILDKEDRISDTTLSVETLEHWWNIAGIAGAGILGASALCIYLGKHLKNPLVNWSKPQ